MSVWGTPLALGGGGGLPLLSRAEWNALTPEQKRAYGLLAIRDADSGFQQGILVDGAAYSSFEIAQSGTGSFNQTFTVTETGQYRLYVIALNSEASTYQLTVTAAKNGEALTGETLDYHSYAASGTNRRNYRFLVFPLDAAAGDSIEIVLTQRTSYSAFVYALCRSDFTAVSKLLSQCDAVCSGANSVDGAVLYGTFNGASNQGTVNGALYTAGTTITTANPGTSYRSAYIFWLTEGSA